MRNIFLSETALVHLEEWKASDAKMLSKIVSLITEIARSPFEEPVNQNHYGTT